jgi:hypothetical protein
MTFEAYLDLSFFNFWSISKTLKIEQFLVPFRLRKKVKVYIGLGPANLTHIIPPKISKH